MIVKTGNPNGVVQPDAVHRRSRVLTRCVWMGAFNTKSAGYINFCDDCTNRTGFCLCIARPRTDLIHPNNYFNVTLIWSEPCVGSLESWNTVYLVSSASQEILHLSWNPRFITVFTAAPYYR